MKKIDSIYHCMKTPILVTIVLILLSYSSSLAQIPPQNLILYLNFDDNMLVDNSTYMHSLTDHQTTFDAGVNNTALRLAGVDNYLEVAYSTNLAISNTLTTSLWYKHQRQEGNGFYSLIEQSANENGGHSRYGTWVFNHNLIQTCIEPDACPGGGQLCQRCTTASIDLEEGEWYHIVSLYDGSNLKIYINGVLDATRNFPSSTGISTRAYPLRIGTDIYDPSPVYLAGTLDEIRLYDIALSDQQIQALYDEFIVSGIEEERLTASISLYPSPSSEFIHIEAPFSIDQLDIYNFMGQFVKEASLNDRQNIELKSMENGWYFLKIITGKHELWKRFWVLRN